VKKVQERIYLVLQLRQLCSIGFNLVVITGLVLVFALPGCLNLTSDSDGNEFENYPLESGNFSLDSSYNCTSILSENDSIGEIEIIPENAHLAPLYSGSYSLIKKSTCPDYDVGTNYLVIPPHYSELGVEFIDLDKDGEPILWDGEFYFLKRTKVENASNYHLSDSEGKQIIEFGFQNEFETINKWLTFDICQNGDLAIIGYWGGYSLEIGNRTFDLDTYSSWKLTVDKEANLTSFETSTVNLLAVKLLGDCHAWTIATDNSNAFSGAEQFHFSVWNLSSMEVSTSDFVYGNNDSKREYIRFSSDETTSINSTYSKYLNTEVLIHNNDEYRLIRTQTSDYHSYSIKVLKNGAEEISLTADVSSYAKHAIYSTLTLSATGQVLVSINNFPATDLSINGNDYQALGNNTLLLFNEDEVKIYSSQSGFSTIFYVEDTLWKYDRVLDDQQINHLWYQWDESF
jgi:hypothetical protein